MHQRHQTSDLFVFILWRSYPNKEMLPYARQNESAQRSGTDWNICHGFIHPRRVASHLKLKPTSWEFEFSIETFLLRQLVELKLFHSLPRRETVARFKETCVTRLKHFGLSSAEQWSEPLDRKFTKIDLESAAFCCLLGRWIRSKPKSEAFTS